MKYIVITGVSSGIGNVTTSHCLEQGYYVFGSVRNEEDANSCQNSFGSQFTPLIFDVRDRKSINDAVEIVRRRIGSANLTALINNAGIAISGPLQFIAGEDIQDQFDINVVGLINATQAFLPLLGGIKGNLGPAGRIVNISSVAGTITMPFQTPYAASKHAVESITDGMRRELTPYGIKVISIRPGPVQSDIWQKELAKGDEKYDHTIYKNVWRGKNKMISSKERLAAPTRSVSKTILKAIEAKSPKRHYLVYKSLVKYYFVRMIPVSLLDRMVRRQLSSLMQPKTEKASM